MNAGTARMLCPQCGEVNKVSIPGDSIVTLGCGHQREKTVPPAKGVSLELLNSEPGKRLYPPDYAGERGWLLGRRGR